MVQQTDQPDWFANTFGQQQPLTVAATYTIAAHTPVRILSNGGGVKFVLLSIFIVNTDSTGAIIDVADDNGTVYFQYKTSGHGPMSFNLPAIALPLNSNLNIENVSAINMTAADSYTIYYTTQ